MSLLGRIAKKIRRRLRMKRSLRRQMARPSRNWHPVTAVDLWQRVYQFKETPAARAGTKRARVREAKAKGRIGRLQLAIHEASKG